jgi:hypothetical protein
MGSQLTLIKYVSFFVLNEILHMIKRNFSTKKKKRIKLTEGRGFGV